MVKNNLANAIAEKRKGGLDMTTAELSIEDLMNLSLKYYNEGKFLECIEVSKKIIEIEPNRGAYNNICAAYNNLGKFAEAAEACKKALQIDPDFELARSNLNYSLERLK